MEVETILLSASATYPLVDPVFQEPESGQAFPSKSEISDRIRQLVLFEIDDLDDAAGAVQF